MNKETLTLEKYHGSGKQIGSWIIRSHSLINIIILPSVLEAVEIDDGDLETPLADFIKSSVDPLIELLDIPGTFRPVFAVPPA